MAFKTFIAGEEALASDINTYLMGQTVMRFASAAARTAALSAPIRGQVTALDTRIGYLQIFDGSTWIDAGTPFVQMGFASGTLNANAEVAITFPVAFATTPAAFSVTELVSSPAIAPASFAIATPGTTASQVVIRQARAGVNTANAAYQFYWIAFGPRVAAT